MAIFFSELSGSATSTGSFGSVNIDTNISESSPLTIDGTSGRLFTVTDQMSGSVFSANLISGLPVIEAFSDNKVNIGPFSSPIQIDGSGNLSGSSSSTGSFGRVEVAGNFEAQGRVRGTRLDINTGAKFFSFNGSNFSILSSGESSVTSNATNVVVGRLALGSTYSNIDVGRHSFTSTGYVMSVHQSGTKDIINLFSPNVGVLSKFDVSGSLLLNYGDVSGSSTSTGSFGLSKIQSSTISSESDIMYFKPDGVTSRMSLSSQGPSVSNIYTPSIVAAGGNSLNIIASGLFLNLGADYDSTGGNIDIYPTGKNLGTPKTARFNPNATFFYKSLDITGHVTASGNISGSATSTGSFAMLRFGDGGANVFLRAKSANLAIGNLNTYPDFRDTSGGNYNTAIGTEVFMDLTSGERNTAVGYQAGRHNVGGDYNSFFGWSAGRGPTSGAPSHTGNTAVGYQSLFSLNTGGDNVAVGRNALYQLDKGSDSVGIGKSAGHYATGSYNTFVGSGAGKGGTTSAPFSSGEDNVAIGYNALVSFTTAYDSVAVGYEALALNTTGGDLVAVGKNALTSNTIGYRSTAVGDGALYHNTEGSRNTGLGRLAGYHNQTGGQNVAVGESAMLGSSGQSNNYNIGIGYQSLLAITIGNGNVAVGHQSGQAITSTGNVVLIGRRAGYSINSTDALGTVAVGYNAGYSITSGQGNVAIGYQTLYTEDTGDFNTAIGHQSLYSQNRDGTVSNTAVGYKAGYAVTTGYEATLVGANAGVSLTEGIQNTLIGGNVADSLTTGDYNTVVGARALYSEDVGRFTTAIGYQAGYHQNSDSNDEDTGNTFLGASAGFYNVTGTGNTLVGRQAGNGTDGNSYSNATAVGYKAGYSLTTGRVTAFGYQAGFSSTTGGGVHIGYQAGYSQTTGNQNVSVGDNALYSNQTNVYNVAIGNSALYSLAGSSLDGNVAIGWEAGKNAQSDTGTVMIGYRAGRQQTGHSSVSIGYEAGLYAENGQSVHIGRNAGAGTGTHNNIGVAVGYQAGIRLRAGGGHAHTFVGWRAGHQMSGSNDFFGYSAGYGSVSSAPYGSGQFNVGIGTNALYSLSTGDSNTAVGRDAGKAITTATGNTLVGKSSGDVITTAEYNTAVGVGSLGALTTDADNNTAIGAFAASSINNTAAIENVAIGAYAGTGGTGALKRTIAIGKNALNSTGTADIEGAIAIGYNALTAANNAAVGHSIAIGHSSLSQLTSGQINIGIGFQSFNSTTTGMFNIGIGYGTGTFNITGTGNIYIGYQAGTGNYQAGSQGSNVGIGYQALRYVTTAQRNVAIGYRAGYDLLGAADNVMVGQQSGENITSGPRNTLLGHSTGDTITTGEQNILIGYGADVSSTAGSNRIGIGHNVQVTADNTTVIGGAGQTKVTVSGSGVELTAHPVNNATASFGMIRAKGAYQSSISLPNDSYVAHWTSTDAVINARHLYAKGGNTSGRILQFMYNHEPMIYASTGSFGIMAGDSNHGDGMSPGQGGGLGFHNAGSSVGYLAIRSHRPSGNSGHYGLEITNYYGNKSSGSFLVEPTATIDLIKLRGDSNVGTSNYGTLRIQGNIDTAGGVGETRSRYFFGGSSNSAIMNTKRMSVVHAGQQVNVRGGGEILSTSWYEVVGLLASGNQANILEIDSTNRYGGIGIYGVAGFSTGGRSYWGGKFDAYMNGNMSTNTGNVCYGVEGKAYASSSMTDFKGTFYGVRGVADLSDHGGNAAGGSIIGVAGECTGKTGVTNAYGVYSNPGTVGTNKYSFYGVNGNIYNNGNIILTGTKKIQFGSNDTGGGIKESSGVMSLGDVEEEDAITQFQLKVYGSTVLQADDDGVTKPKHPSFLAHASSNQNNLSNDTKVNFATEVFDVRGNYNTSTSTFTAPLTGKYLLGFHLRLASIDISATRYFFNIITSNRNYVTDIFTSDSNAFNGDLSYWSVGGTVVADMDASDTAHIQFFQTGGSAQTDVYGTSSPQSRFFGYLLG